MDWKRPEILTKNYISGCKFHDISKFNVCPRYPQRLDLSNTNEDDIVFLNLDYFESFFNYLDSQNFTGKFTLLTHNSDRDFTNSMLQRCDKFTKKIYAINCTVKDEKIIKIPLGFNDQSTIVIDNFDLTPVKKNNLIYSNFKICHHPERSKCFEYFSNFEWVDFFMDGMNNIRQLPFRDFYETLRTYKYCISPRGAGIDTHRTYESIYFDVVPILKTSELDDLHSKLPVLIVNEWSEITLDYLNDNYMLSIEKLKDWKSSNKNWYLTEHWIKN